MREENTNIDMFPRHYNILYKMCQIVLYLKLNFWELSELWIRNNKRSPFIALNYKVVALSHLLCISLNLEMPVY